MLPLGQKELEWSDNLPLPVQGVGVSPAQVFCAVRCPFTGRMDGGHAGPCRLGSRFTIFVELHTADPRREVDHGGQTEEPNMPGMREKLMEVMQERCKNANSDLLKVQVG